MANGVHEVSGSIPLGSTMFSTTYAICSRRQIPGLSPGYQDLGILSHAAARSAESFATAVATNL
ncbi:MAG: hypothetical protein IV086_08880 [Hyphomonadaceae bacterium]|nr:hypothetical protein [Hyphomonadaceae bacterium]